MNFIEIDEYTLIYSILTWDVLIQTWCPETRSYEIYSTHTVTLKYNSKVDFISIISKIPKDFYQKT